MLASAEGLKKLFEFGSRVSKLKGVVAVALFGSAARGEATAGSDIDIAVTYGEKEDRVMREVDELAPEHVHIVHASIDELGKNMSLAGALSGEGIMLSGRPIVFEVQKIGLRPMTIIAYDTAELDQNVRNKLNRALHGGISTSRRGGRRYLKEYGGLIAQPGITKIGKGVLLVPRERVPMVTGTLQKHGAKWKEIAVWTY